MVARLASHWWLFLIRGILALALGIAFPFFPGAAIFTLAILFGAYAFVDGIVAIAAALRMNHAEANWWWLLLEGVLGILVGVLTFFYPGITALWLVYLFGAWAVITGILAIVTAFRIRAAVGNEILMILFGAISVIAGVVIFLYPLYGVLALVWTVSIYAILAGIFLIGLALRLRGLGQGVARAV
ncbi:MAG: HdeD family acid-resistance protein [Candidatus Eremiobacteraeota bacterium]|nr:HdeD family acid-resistance protein [Candidatus Eremiobacteraeota bacterium]